MRRKFTTTSIGFSKPKILFLIAGVLSLALSVGRWVSGSKDQGSFVGLWVPAIHSLGTLVLTDDRRD